MFNICKCFQKYEVRSYEKSYWVTTRMPAKNYWQDKIGSRQAFWRLFGYITGKNEQGKTIYKVFLQSNLEVCLNFAV